MSTITPGFAEVTVSYDVPGSGSPAMTVFGVDAGVITDPRTIADAIGVILASTSSFRDNMDSNTGITRVKVLLNIDGEPFLVGESSTSIAGALSGSALPPNNAYLVKKVTGLSGRQYQGRMYIPGVPEASVNEGGFLETADLASLQLNMNQFLAALSTAGYPMVLLHTAPLATPTSVTSLIVDTRIGTQRRRMR